MTNQNLNPEDKPAILDYSSPQTPPVKLKPQNIFLRIFNFIVTISLWLILLFLLFVYAINSD
jgi:hypothetical protein